MQRGPGQHFHHHQLLAGPTLAVAACPVLAGHTCLCPPGSPCHPSARGSPPVPPAPEGAAAPRAWPQGAGPARHRLLAPRVSLPCLLLLPAGSPPASARGRMWPPACQPPGEASSGSCRSRAGTEQPRAELSPVNEHGGQRSESPAVGLAAAPGCAAWPAGRKGAWLESAEAGEGCPSAAGAPQWEAFQADSVAGLRTPRHVHRVGTSPGTGRLQGPAPGGCCRPVPALPHVPGAAAVLPAPASGSGVTLAPSAPRWGRPLPGRGCWVLAESMNKISP